MHTQQWRNAMAIQYLTPPPPSSVAAFDFKFWISSGDGRGTLRIVSSGTDCDDYTADLSGLVPVPNTGHVSKLKEITM